MSAFTSTIMSNESMKQRHPPASVPVIEKLKRERITNAREQSAHPAGEIKHGTVIQGIRMTLFALYFMSSIFAWVSLAH